MGGVELWATGEEMGPYRFIVGRTAVGSRPWEERLCVGREIGCRMGGWGRGGR